MTRRTIASHSWNCQDSHRIPTESAIAQTALYYEDPDHNSVEFNVDNYGDSWTSGEHLRNSPEFAKNPMGVYIDPDKMIAARKVGASPWAHHERAWQGDFAPPKPYDPRVLL